MLTELRPAEAVPESRKEEMAQITDCRLKGELDQAGKILIKAEKGDGEWDGSDGSEGSDRSDRSDVSDGSDRSDGSEGSDGSDRAEGSGAL